MSNYDQYQLQKDWSFAQELLNRMGLGNFKVIYKPNSLGWQFWNRELGDYIKECFDEINLYTDKLKINWEKEINESTYKEKAEVIVEVLNFLGKEINYANIEDVFYNFIGSSHTCHEFSMWLHRNRDALGIE